MAASTKTTIGFVGLGHIGGSMASRFLAAGYPVHGEERDRAHAEGLIEQGLQWHDAPRDVADAADVVFTWLPDDAVLEEVASAPDASSPGSRPGRSGST